DRHGTTPLPPYIKRKESESSRLDSQSYQTVYARERGAIAAPTAGLHFTPRILEEIERRGVKTVTITHHVGYGTFQPVRVEQIEEHRVEAERFVITEDGAGIMNRARSGGGRIIAVGTTTTRALESAATEAGEIVPGESSTDLYIYPGYR